MRRTLVYVRNFYLLYISGLNFPSLFATAIHATASPVQFSDVTSISIGLLIARISEYAISVCSPEKPTPERIVKRITAPAPGAAGVPILAMSASNIIMINWNTETS